MITFDDLVRQICLEAEPPGADMGAWLEHQPDAFEWLLAHTYSGVVWGRRVVGQWRLSSDIGSDYPQLTASNLLEMRLFGPTGELFVWRTSQGLGARTLFDEEVKVDCQDEKQMVWGTRGRRLNDQFTELIDGQQGLVTAVPFPLAELKFNEAETFRPVRLCVRHYITAHEETGLARITLSRLVKVTLDEERKNGS